ncbi:AI-2E family transporter [Methanosarcina sp. UBA5]|uniref:AI-2E family transporter n=1 Tax=Methanosarcina sp. UBA5 TaxID=1915593 RepID=UPI0025E725FD|nr:AI-2E family transporter [Methanosarcina sp. UBA5]
MGSGDNFSKFTILVTIFVIAIAVYITEPFFSVILFSFLIAYLLVPLYSFLENRTKHRRIAAAASVLLVLTLFVLIGIRIIYAIVTEVSTLLSSPEEVQLLILDITNRVTRIVEINVPFNSPNIISQINHFISGLTDTYFPPTKTLVVFLTATLPFYIVAFIVALIFSYYLLLTGDKLIDQILNFVPSKNEKEVKLFLKELDVIYSGLFRQHFVASAIIGIIALVGLYLLGVPYSSVLASFVFLLSMYPLIGLPGVYLPLTAYYTLLQDYNKALEVLIFSVALNALQDYYLRPKLVEKKGAVHPVMTILAFGAPLLVIGIPGLVIGPAVYGFLLALYRINLKLKEEEKVTLKEK